MALCLCVNPQQIIYKHKAIFRLQPVQGFTLNHSSSGRKTMKNLLHIFLMIIGNYDFMSKEDKKEMGVIV